MVFLGLGLFIFMILYWNFESAYLEECRLKGIPSSECSLLDKLISDFKSVKLGWIGLMILAYMVSNVLRSLRWLQLLQPLGYSPKFLNALGATMIGYFTNLALPRVGEIIKIGTLSRYEAIPFEKVTGTIVIDRILDFIAFFIVIGISLILSFPVFRDYFKANFEMPSGSKIYLILGILTLGAFALITILMLGRRKNQSPFFKKINNIISGFADGLKSIALVKEKWKLIGYTIGIWVMYYLMTYMCFFSFSPVSYLGPVAGLIVFVFGSLGMIFPSPGGMGSYHFLVTQALLIYGINSSDAFSFSNIIFFPLTIIGNSFFGILFLILLPIINRSKNA